MNEKEKAKPAATPTAEDEDVETKSLPSESDEIDMKIEPGPLPPRT